MKRTSNGYILFVPIALAIAMGSAQLADVVAASGGCFVDQRSWCQDSTCKKTFPANACVDKGCDCKPPVEFARKEFEWKDICKKKPMATGVGPIGLQLYRVAQGQGSGFFAIGAQYSASLTTGGTWDIENDGPTWGYATDNGLQLGTLGFVFRVDAHPDPAKRYLTLLTLAGDIPSFVHSASSPDETGDNLIQLASGLVGTLEVDTVSRAVEGSVYGTITNAFYGDENPIRFSLNVNGTINPTTSRMDASLSYAQAYVED